MEEHFRSSYIDEDQVDDAVRHCTQVAEPACLTRHSYQLQPTYNTVYMSTDILHV